MVNLDKGNNFYKEIDEYYTFPPLIAPEVDIYIPENKVSKKFIESIKYNIFPLSLLKK